MFDWKDGAILAATALGVLIYDTSRSYKSLEVDIAGYKVYDVNFGANSATLQINLRIKNPLLLGVTLYSLVGGVSIDGIHVADVDKVYDYYVRGKRTHIIPIVCKCDIMSVAQVFARMLAGNDSMALQFNGELRLGKNGVVSLPVNVGMVMDGVGI